MKLRETFGSNCRQYRKSIKITQTELADRAGISLDMIGRIERGVVAPSFDKIEKLAEVLGVPEMAFFGSGMLSVPGGDRGRALQQINRELSKMNDNELARVPAILKAVKS